MANLGLFWVSTVDNNTTNPDFGGVGWTLLGSGGTTSIVAPTSTTINATIAQRRIVLRSTLTSALTLNLPANAPAGYALTLVDYNGTSNSYPVTIYPPSGVVNGLSSFLFGNPNAVYSFVKYGIDGSGHDIWGVE